MLDISRYMDQTLNNSVPVILYVDEEFPGGPSLPWTFSGNGLEFRRLEDWPQILWKMLYSLLQDPNCRNVNSKVLHYVRQGKSDVGVIQFYPATQNSLAPYSAPPHRHVITFQAKFNIEISLLNGKFVSSDIVWKNRQDGEYYGED
jgi:hypothetical protein